MIMVKQEKMVVFAAALRPYVVSTAVECLPSMYRAIRYASVWEVVRSPQGELRSNSAVFVSGRQICQNSYVHLV